MRKRHSLQLVALEDRSTPATFTVTTIVDNGSNVTPTAGSLRAAIINANATAGLDTINFNISGGGVQPIAPPITLPDITDPVVIDGTSQPGFAGTPVIRLDGSNAGAGANGLSLVGVTGSTIKSLTIGGFKGAGIRISGGSSNNVYGSFIGTTQNGTVAQPNGVGIQIENASLGVAIGGNGTNQRNIISGNTGPGVRIDNSYNTLVAGNFIGTDLNGINAVPNAGGGVALVDGAAGDTVGGISAGLGNVISGNGTAGVILDGATTTGNVIVGNRIGQNFSGIGLGNTGPGIKAFNGADSNPPGGAVAGSENTIRSNTIADNSGAGVAVLDTSRQIRIDANSIHDNVGLGIQVDSTANAGLKAPTITSMSAVTGGQDVNGTFSGTANTKYDVNFFTNSTADASGFGEGQTQVGTVSVTTDGSGNGTFLFLLATGTGGTFITATVTQDTLGDTSSFSNAFARPDILLTSGSYAVGGGEGGDGTVVFTDNIGTTIRTNTYFGANFTGGARVATGDLTNDSIPDLAVGTGPGTQALVQVYNGATQQLLFTVNPFGTFTGGVFVALGDINNDGYADLIITPDEGGGPRVRVFNGKTFTQMADFFGINDVNFRGGARAAVGDMNDDKFGDIIVTRRLRRRAAHRGFQRGTVGLERRPQALRRFLRLRADASKRRLRRRCGCGRRRLCRSGDRRRPRWRAARPHPQRQNAAKLRRENADRAR